MLHPVVESREERGDRRRGQIAKGMAAYGRGDSRVRYFLLSTLSCSIEKPLGAVFQSG